MKAVRLHELGGPEVLVLEEVPVPTPAPGEVLVRVKAATVNHTDLFHRGGRFFIQKPLPHVLGMDLAGEVAALGEGVTDWQVGDRVVATFEDLGRARDGAYAEYTTVPADQLHAIPQALDFPGAAAIGLATATAWIALIFNGRVQATDRVVVHAASSGVGSAAVQIARWRGAHVTAISSPGKHARLRELGADVVLDRSAPDLAERVVAATETGASLVLDLVGRTTLDASVRMLARGGRIVCAGTLSGDRAEFDVMELIMRRGRLIGSFEAIRPRDFNALLALHAAGSLKPVIDVVWPLSRAREAHERVERQEGFGKVVLVP